MTVSMKTAISRRNAMGKMAGVAVASVALPGLAPAAQAMAGSSDLRTFRGKYALAGGQIIDGYFISPLGTAPIDTVVVLHGEAGLDSNALALAQSYARAGKMAVLPDLPATYRGVAALAGRDAHIASVKALGDKFARHARATGKIEFVAA